MKDESEYDSKSKAAEFDPKMLEYYSYLRSIVETNEISYWIGNPSVSIMNGQISLTPLSIPQDHYDTHQEYLDHTRHLNHLEASQEDSPTRSDKKQEIKEEPCLRSRCLALCGIPNNKSPVEILENSSIGQYRSAIIEMRVIKTVQLRYYAMLLKFKNNKSATNFFNDLFGLPYNEIQMECIVLREMVDITLSISQILKDGESTDLKILRKPSEECQNQRMPAESIFMGSNPPSSQLTIKGQETARLECSICLEEINIEIISILCGHYFHCGCLQRWQINTCPLCRYHQQPPVISFCEQCNQCQGLWVCLICGIRLCCGGSNDILAQDSHIYQHYKDSGHGLSMELQTKFIFDARVPAFLHQMFYRDLIRRGLDGSSEQGMEESIEKDDTKKNKLSDTISMYQNQVALEMQKQRCYFEDSLNKQIKIHKEITFKKKEELKSVQKQLQKVKLQIEQSTKKGETISKNLQDAEKQQKIIINLQKMYYQKIQKCNQKLQKSRNMEKKRLQELDNQIEQKKMELLNYKQNLALKSKLEGKLKGQAIEESIFLMGDKPKKKKK